MSQYTCGWFKIEDLVPPSIFHNIGTGAWELFDDRLLTTLDRLRNIYGPMLINNWAYGGDREWNGLRTTECPFYNMYGQHEFGRAANITFENFENEEVKNDILNGPNLHEFEYISTVMSGPDYLHIDVRNRDRVSVLLP